MHLGACGCFGKDFRNRRDGVIIRLFLHTGMRPEGMSGLRYIADDPERSDVDLRSGVVRITAKRRLADAAHRGQVGTRS